MQVHSLIPHLDHCEDVSTFSRAQGGLPGVVIARVVYVHHCYMSLRDGG